MKKFIFGIIIGLLFIPTVFAANMKIAVSSNKSTVVLGEVINVTVTVSSPVNLGSWEFDLKYDSTKLNLTYSSFGGTHIADVVTSSNQKSKTYNFTFTTRNKGNASISIANSIGYDFDEKLLTPDNGSKSIKILTKAELEASYSSNNYLKTLKVNDINIPLNKTNLEYTIELEPNTVNGKINAVAEDGKSSINYDKEVELEDGDNIFEIKVNAENGKIRIYNLNIHVKELDPISVTVDKKELFIIRKIKNECPTLFTKETYEYLDKEVVTCFNETTNLRLFLLKNSDKTDYYVFDETFKIYNELIFNRMIVYYINNDFKVSKDFVEKEIKINDKSLKVYTYKDDNNYSLFYGMNVETGEKNIYLYNKKESTIQKYFDNIVLKQEKTIKKYGILFILFSVLITVLFGLTIFMLIQNKKIRQNKQNVI